MVLSLLVYIGTALVLFALGKNLEVRERKYWLRTHSLLSFWQWEILLSILVFGVIAGARYNTGVDHLSYLDIYEKMQQGIDYYRIKDGSIELGYIYMTRFFAKTLNAHYFYYFAFLAMMQIGFVYYALKDKKYLLPIVGALIMLGPFFLSWMNGIRQTICCCCFIFLVNYIVERKLVHYVVWVLVCTLMHKSALLLLPCYFISYLKIPENKVVNLFVLGVCVFIGLTPTWLKTMDEMSFWLEFLGYDRYSERMEVMIQYERNVEWGPSRLGLFFLDVLVVWYYSNVKKYFKDDKFFEYSFALFFIGLCGYNLFVNTSHIFTRPIMYFRAFNLVVQVYTFIYLLKFKKNVIFYVFAFFMFYHTIYVVFKSGLYSSSDEYSLYHLFFLL